MPFFPWTKEPPIINEDGSKTIRCVISLPGILNNRGNEQFKDLLCRHIRVLRQAQSDEEALNGLNAFLNIWSDE